MKMPSPRRPATLLASVALLLATALPAPARAQSFSCEMSHTEDQRTVCADRYLRKLDAVMARQQVALKRHLKTLRKTNAARAQHFGKQLLEQERAFLGQRAACGGEVACIEKLYEERIMALLHAWRALLR